MRIAFSGTANSGKTTLLKSFLYTWSNFSTPEKTYRDMLVEKELDHSSSTTTETQSEVMNFMVDQLFENSKDDCVVYDRCPLDSVAYTLWSNDKNKDGVNSNVIKLFTEIKKTTEQVKQLAQAGSPASKEQAKVQAQVQAQAQERALRVLQLTYKHL